MSKLKATAFWNELHTEYPNERVYNWMCAIAEGNGDWFRNLSLANVAISEHCQIGRFGFDDAKYKAGQNKVNELLAKYQLTGLMQQ